MPGPYDLSGGRSVVEKLPRLYCLEKPSGPYEPRGLFRGMILQEPSRPSFEEQELEAW